MWRASLYRLRWRVEIGGACQGDGDAVSDGDNHVVLAVVMEIAKIIIMLQKFMTMVI